MAFSRVSLLVFCISLICFFFSSDARSHHHVKHKHTHHHHNVSEISEPPSLPPLSADPSNDDNAYNSTDAPSHPPEASSSSHDHENAYNSTPSPSPSPSPETTHPPNHGRGYPPSRAPSPSPSPAYAANVFDVRKFGAIGDGLTDDTEAFKMAWDSACQEEDSAVLLVPYGSSFMIQSTIFTGPCQGGLVFQVDGTLMPPDGPDSWAQKNSKRQWLVFYRVKQMSLQGGGVIDGRGQKWWDLPCKPHKGINGTTLPGPCDSPIAIRFFMSSNLTVQGIRVKDSPQFNFRFDNCKNVHVESIHITAPPLSPNTDGIHIENANDVKIYNSVISNGDDCVSIGSGCYDVDIRNITCGPGHGISIGSLGNHNSKACVSNITVRDSVIKSSNNGVRIKTWQGGSGAVSGITFSNIHMNNVKNPIIIDQFYCLSKGCSNQTSAVYVSDIVYENIKGTYDIRSPPMHFACSDSVPCTNLTLSDVELLPAKGDLVSDPYCWNAYGDLQTLTIPPVSCLMEGVPRSLQNNDIDHC
ncbi:hypothetical protein Q3G72_029468 [Acer saccharum]|nr:hypothetical protein Q3G72_029468 [Acer saccharum]